MADNFFGLTDTGRVRTNNEDAFIAQKMGRYIAGCVIDGVGGYEGGEVAAGIARQAIIDYLSVPSGDIITMMREAFAVANERIEAEKKRHPQYESMACVATLAMVDVAAKTFSYAHIGDTRLYLFHDDTLVKITKDQSFVGYLEDSGRITEDEAMQHPKRNEINNAIGFAATLNAADIETGTSPFLPGDLLLLCSDGLSDLLTSSDMLRLVQQEEQLAAKAKALVQLANERGGKDNITTVLVRNHRKPVLQKATKPVAATHDVKKNVEVQTPLSKPAPKRRKNSRRVIVIAILCLLLVTAVASWLFEKHTLRNIGLRMMAPEKTTQELDFQQALASAPNGIFKATDSVAALPLVLNDTIWIKQDTFHFNGNGMRFLKSSAFGGAAFALGDSCKYVLLENMVFENFDAGILASNNALHLKNVRFIGCRIPVLTQMRFPENKPLNGSVSNFFAPDSLHH